MRHFVGYHSTTTMGYELDVQPDDEGYGFLSKKRFSDLEKSIGNRVWMVCGTMDRGKANYRLHGYYSVDGVEEGSRGFDWSVFGAEGTVFPEPIDLNDYEWFPLLRKEQGNFGFGVNEIKNENVIAGLKQIVLKAPKKLQAPVKQKSSSNSQAKQSTRARDLLPEEIGDEDYPDSEGAITVVIVNRYERSLRARERCIEHYGLDCVICGLNFKRVYGDAGGGIIHVHHLKPLSEIRKSYRVNPVKDLRPVCPNCHAMIHNRHPMFTIEEVKKMLGRKKQSAKN